MTETTIDIGPVHITMPTEAACEAAIRYLHQPLTGEQAADYLGVSIKTIYRWRRQGRLPSPHTGPLRRIDLLSLMPLPPQRAGGSPGKTASPALPRPVPAHP